MSSWGKIMPLSMNRRRCLLGAGAVAATAALPQTGRAQEAVKLPPIPTSDMWAKSPAIQHVALSDDGGSLAYIKEAGGQKTLYVIELSTSKVRPFLIGSAKVSGLQWLDASHLILGTLATGKEEAFAGGRQTFGIETIYNIEKLTTNTLFSRVEGFKSFVAGGVSRARKNGKTFVTAASYPVDGKGDGRTLFRFDLDNGDVYEVLDRGTWDTDDWLLTPEGDLVARTTYHRKQHVWSLEYRVGNAWKEIFSRPADLESPGLWGLAQDGKSLIVSLPAVAEGDAHNYYELSPDGVLSEPLLKDAFNRAPLFDSVTERHSGFTFYDGWSHPTYFDPARQAIYDKAQAAVDGYRMSIVERADDPNKVIIYTEGSDDAGSYYYIDFTTGKTIAIGSNYPQIPAEWISEKRAIKYKASDGLEIEAYLTLPPNRDARNLPLVVYPHGGPEWRDGLEIDVQGQTYADMGYAVLQPNFRGSSGYGLKFLQAGYGEWGRKMQTDLSDGVRYLAAQGIVDPKRVCIVGASYGGYAALAGATLDTGIYRCAVDVAGISDVKDLLELQLYEAGDSEHIPGTYRYLKRFLGDITKLDEISPIRHVEKCTIPVLIVHGKDDTVVQFSQSTNMVAALKAAGKDVTFVQYDHEDHWETNEAARTDMMKIITAFIAKHNPA